MAIFKDYLENKFHSSWGSGTDVRAWVMIFGNWSAKYLLTSQKLFKNPETHAAGSDLITGHRLIRQPYQA